MRPPILRLYEDELIVDNFAGGGGASTGIFMATGRHPDIAVNHDHEALAMYKANHPTTRVMCEDVFNVNPRFVCGSRPVGLAWFSPDCTYFSRARGSKPFRDRNKARRRRGLAGVALRWAEEKRPRVVLLENVPEFLNWGPLGKDGRPDPARRGQSFQRWAARWRNLGYAIDWRELRACDFGAPTSRKRLFIVARCDGEAISWPEATHGKGCPQPHRTAAECIDWTIPCPSIFGRKKPLAEATLRRIARGIKRYVIDAKQPFIVPVAHAGDERVHSVDEPLRTVTGAHRGEHAVVTPFLARIGQTGGNGAYVNDPRDPLTTATTKAEHLLIAPTLIQASWGEREGQAPRCLDIQAPLGTTVSGGIKHAVVTAFLSTYHGDAHPGDVRGAGMGEQVPTVDTSNRFALVSAFLAKHFGGHEGPGTQASLPLGTVTARDHHALVTSSLVKLKGTCRDGQPVTEPLGTVQAQGLHYAEVRAFLIKYYGTGDGDAQLSMPLHTVTTKDRFAIVTVAGIDYAIVDIGMRMLEPRELFNANGFPRGYIIDPVVEKRTRKGRIVERRLTKTAQVEKCGNCVPPDFARELVLAQFGEQDARAAGGAA